MWPSRSIHTNWLIFAGLAGLIAVVANVQSVSSPTAFSNESFSLVSTVANGVNALADVPLAVTVSSASAVPTATVPFSMVIAFGALALLTGIGMIAHKRTAPQRITL